MRSPGTPIITVIVVLSGAVLGRVVRVPPSPLLRVEGTDVAISCNVSDYEGPREQNFEWRFSSGAGPAVNVLSTWDGSFTQDSYLERVTSGGVRLERIGNSEVLLHVQDLRASDGGNYTCITPSTDATYRGNYEDQVQIKVIADPLRVAAPRGRRGAVYNVTWGGRFQVLCQASVDDGAAHLHLSLTWQRRSHGDISEVLTLTHQGRLQPGTDYAARYSSGDLRVDTAASDTYLLTVEGAEPGDAGDYSCVAQTWVQGAAGWEKIQEKVLEAARVQVRPIGLEVSVMEPSLVVAEGAPFTLLCRVSVDSSAPLITRVRWFFAQSGELHSVPGGPDPDPSPETPSTHQLLVPQAWDSGEYSCHVTAWSLLRNGTWHPAAEQRSPPARVQVIGAAVDLQVSLNVSVAPQAAEEPSELWCQVGGASHLSVSWYFSPEDLAPSSGPVLVGSLDGEGSLQVGEDYVERMERGALILSRRGPQSFVLRLQWTSEQDRGRYHCTGTSWKLLRNQSWTPGAEATSAPVTLSWESEGSSMVVGARLMRGVSAAGGVFEMMCTVQAQGLASPQYSVQVIRRPPQEAAAPLITLGRDGVVRRRPGVSSSVLEKGKEGVYLFRLSAAQGQDVGSYQCEVTAWTQGGGGAWRMAHNMTTNAVPLEFMTSGPVFNVSARSDVLSVHRGDRSEFWCIISIEGPALDPGDLAYDVSWFVQKADGSSVFLAGTDRSAQIRHSPRNSSSEVSLERVSHMEYRLRVYGCQEDDAGRHYCTVTPWVRSREGGWSQQDAVTSNTVSLSVRMDLLSAFQYPLLIGAGLSLLAGLVSCLIGYCSSRFCCKAPPVQEKRRERHRLMSMEMD